MAAVAPVFADYFDLLLYDERLLLDFVNWQVGFLLCCCCMAEEVVAAKTESLCCLTRSCSFARSSRLLMTAVSDLKALGLNFDVDCFEWCLLVNAEED